MLELVLGQGWKAAAARAQPLLPWAARQKMLMKACVGEPNAMSKGRHWALRLACGVPLQQYRLQSGWSVGTGFRGGLAMAAAPRVDLLVLWEVGMILCEWLVPPGVECWCGADV